METLSQTAIAAQLQVSRSTVSHVLNGRGHLIREETRRKVEEALKASGYHRNSLVRSLKTKRTHVVGIIVPEMGRSFFSEIVRAAEEEAQSRGFQCFLAQSHSNPDAIQKSLLTMREYRVDGVLINPSSSSANAELYQRLIAQNFPFVLVDSPIVGIEASFVGNDNIEVGRLATEHLISLGHRRIVCLRGDPEVLAAQHRVEGYNAAMAAAGLPVDNDLVGQGSFQFQGAQEAMRRLIASGVMFTGVVAPSDHAALGAIQALSRAGRRVPEDVSVVGCANIDIAAMANPALTTVDQKPGELGMLAMRELIRRIEDRRALVTSITIRPSLVARQSTAPVS